MNNKNLDDNKIETTPSLKQVFIMIAVLLFLAICFIAVSALEDARVWETGEITVSNIQVSCVIDKVTVGEYITFDSCYAEIPGEYINTWDVTVVLRPVGEVSGLYIPTYMSDSATDIITYRKNEGNYNRTTFEANVASDKLSLQDTEYDILLYYNNNDRDIYIDTGRDLTKEGLK